MYPIPQNLAPNVNSPHAESCIKNSCVQVKSCTLVSQGAGLTSQHIRNLHTASLNAGVFAVGAGMKAGDVGHVILIHQYG